MIHFSIKGFSGAFEVHAFVVREALSELFEIDVELVSKDRDAVPGDLVGQEATLGLPAGDTTRFFHGVVAMFEIDDDRPGSAAYRALVMPRAHELRYRRDSRIFQEKTTLEIVKSVLEEHGVSGPRLHDATVGASPQREYCVQYRESDWAFVARLLEEDGVTFFFEHKEHEHVMTLANAPSSFAAIGGHATVLYRPDAGSLAGREEAVTRLRFSQELRTGKVTLRDYNFERPALSLEVHTALGKTPKLEHYDSPGDYEEPAAGDVLAKTRMEELRTSQTRARGTSDCRRLVPGFTFTLAEHPRSELNLGWLCARVVHHGSFKTDELQYHNEIELVPSKDPLRPTRVTPKPIIAGVQSAIVVGPAGEEIFTDRFGRVKVQFHWDRLGKKDEHSSCWMRVSQAWAGPAFGTFFLPRIGHEVLVSFLEGDPDRPLVTGCVHHGANVTPYALPGDKTKSTIKSQTSPGGGGSNELRFEDKAGQEEIYLHGQKDWNIVIEHDKTQHIGHDETLDVANDRTKTVDHDQSETIGNDKTISVGQNHTEEIGKDMTLTVGGALSEEVSEEASITIGKDLELSVGGDMSESIAKSVEQEIGEDLSISVGKAFELAVAKDASITVSGSSSEDVTKAKTISAGESFVVDCGDGKITVKKDGTVTIEGKDITVKASGKLKVQAAKIDIKTDGACSVEASGQVKIKGSAVGLN